MFTLNWLIIWLSIYRDLYPEKILVKDIYLNTWFYRLLGYI